MVSELTSTDHSSGKGGGNHLTYP